MKALLLDSFYYTINIRLRDSYLLERIYYLLERKCIKLHLKVTEARLLTEDTRHLSAAQRNARLTALRHLRNYWQREEFPQNIVNPVRREPYFRDHTGRLCALAYLVEMSGRSDIVDDLFRTNNTVFVKDVMEGPLLEWIHENGFSKDEAALIQPTYGGGGFFGGSPRPPTFLGTLLPYLWLLLGIVAFVFLEYGAHVFIAALNVSKGKRALLFVYFSLINILVATVIGLFMAALMDYFFVGGRLMYLF